MVSSELSGRGLEPFRFFSFTPIGLAVLLVAVAYMWLVGRNLLPGAASSPPKSEARTLEDLWNGYGLTGKGHAVRVPESSPLAGRTLAESRLGTRFHARVIAIDHGNGDFAAAPGPDAELHPGDVLIVVAHRSDVEAIGRELGLEAFADAMGLGRLAGGHSGLDPAVAFMVVAGSGSTF